MDREYIHEKKKHKGGKKGGHHAEPSNVQIVQPYVPDGERVPVQHMSQVVKDNAEKGIFDFDKINGYTLVEVVYKTPSKKAREDMREDFNKRARPEFLRMLAAEHEDELRAMGIKDDGLALMREGKSVNGFNVHHNLPIAGGGTNDFRNLTIMPIPPHDELHHNIIDPQLKKGSTGHGMTIKLPYYGKMVWQKPDYKYEYAKEGEGPDLTYINERNAENKARMEEKKHKPTIDVATAKMILKQQGRV